MPVKLFRTVYSGILLNPPQSALQVRRDCHPIMFGELPFIRFGRHSLYLMPYYVTNNKQNVFILAIFYAGHISQP